jgi:uncharacterized protein
MSDDLSALSSFDGVARLFPLPNVVFFPRVMLPLHIFEPRYRQMTTDALAGDQFIAMSLLKPGWEPEYNGQPEIHPVACLGKIVADQRLEDGRYNILLRGLSRIRIIEEAFTDKLYRTAHVELLKENGVPAVEQSRELSEQLQELVSNWLLSLGLARDQVAKLFQNQLPLGPLADVLSFALPLAVEFKQELLQELHTETRVRRLLTHLRANAPPKIKAETGEHEFPPQFSDN